MTADPITIRRVFHKSHVNQVHVSRGIHCTNSLRGGEVTAGLDLKRSSSPGIASEHMVRGRAE